MRLKRTSSFKKLISFVLCLSLLCNLCLYSANASREETKSPTNSILEIPEPKPTVEISQSIVEVKTVSEVERIDLLVDKICANEQVVTAELVKSIIYHESRYNKMAYNSGCYGLMQISKKWHKDRMQKLHVEDLYDEESNIIVGVDYIKELLEKYKDIKLVLMLYNMKTSSAFKLYKQGKITSYVKNILSMSIRREQGEVFDATG
jgi:hypothetical protein